MKGKWYNGASIAAKAMGRMYPPYRAELVLDDGIICANPDTSIPSDPQLLSELAVRCYEEAERSSDRPPTADIDVKTAFGLGQVLVWQSVVRYGDHWDEAQGYLQTVLDLYAASGPERQVRIRAAAAHANAWLGLRLISTDGSNVESVSQAFEYYRAAVALLRLDINRTYNQTWIDLYTRQFESLEAWLTVHTTTDHSSNAP